MSHSPIQTDLGVISTFDQTPVKFEFQRDNSQRWEFGQGLGPIWWEFELKFALLRIFRTMEGMCAIAVRSLPGAPRGILGIPKARESGRRHGKARQAPQGEYEWGLASSNCSCCLPVMAMRFFRVPPSLQAIRN